MQVAEGGVTVVVESGPEGLRITVRRAWWRGEAISAALMVLISLGASGIASAFAWSMAAGPGDSADRASGRALGGLVAGVFAAWMIVVCVRRTIPYWLSFVAGEEAIEIAAPTATGRRVTVWRRGVIRTWRESFDMTEDAVVVTAARRPAFLECTGGGPYTVGLVGGLRVDGATAEWECRIGPGISTSLADRLVRALGGTGEVPWLTLRLPPSR